MVQIERVEDASGLPELAAEQETRKFIGSARVGWASASWPFATLLISRDELVLSMAMFGDYRFKPEDVISVEKVGGVLAIGQAIRIDHTREDVAERVLFYRLGSPRRLLDVVDECGFVPSADPRDKPASRKWPFRAPFVVAAVILWNVLFLIDRPWDRGAEGKFIWGPGIFTALGLVFVGTQLIRRWEPLQRLALNGPWALERIERPRRFIAFVSGTMLVVGAIAAMLAG